MHHINTTYLMLPSVIYLPGWGGLRRALGDKWEEGAQWPQEPLETNPVIKIKVCLRVRQAI